MKVTLFNIIGRRLLKMDWYFPCNYGAHDREMILIDSSWRQGNDCDIVTECLIRIILDRWKCKHVKCSKILGLLGALTVESTGSIKCKASDRNEELIRFSNQDKRFVRQIDV